MKTSILQNRKDPNYRYLESVIGVTSISFLLLIFVTAILSPAIASVFLIIYSFMWLLKYTLNVIYTIYIYKQLRRWEKLDWPKFFVMFDGKGNEKVHEFLTRFGRKYKNKLDFEYKINEQKKALKNAEGTKFENPNDIYQSCIFSIYNESSEVVLKSLKCIYESGYPMEKVIVVVSQEARYGEANNQEVRDGITKVDWINSYNVGCDSLETVYSDDHKNLVVSKKYFGKVKLSESKLNIIFTQHPDGLSGEIKGKSSNEDWGGRQLSLFLKEKGIDPQTILVTSLDADSHIGKYFFHHLSFVYCATGDRLKTGYQPIHSYSNNLFETGLWPRQVATQTGLSNLTNLGMEGDTPFFAIYAVPMSTLQEIDFWIRDVIAEDAMMFNKCLVHFEGEFKVVPFYGVFEGDAVEADDYVEAIASQYKQLLRWAWGGVEDFPYIYKSFFWDEAGKKIDLRLRLRWTYLKFINHFFWSSSPVVFSLGVLAPQFFGGDSYRQTQTAQNLGILSQYFSWVSFIFIISFGYISIMYFAFKASGNSRLTIKQLFMIISQLLLSPFLYAFMGVPAMDAQIRGINGKYIGYWVTPKK
jgi:hypothetical protein